MSTPRPGSTTPRPEPIAPRPEPTIAPRLEPITPANFANATGVKVRADQEFAVAPVLKSLAEAYVYGDRAWPRLILDGERTVGFLMAFLGIDWHGGGTSVRSGLWRLNIAAGEQGKGYGRSAVRAVADELRRRGEREMYVSWNPAENGPEGFYLGLGFRRTGEMSGEQVVGVLELDA